MNEHDIKARVKLKIRPKIAESSSSSDFASESSGGGYVTIGQKPAGARTVVRRSMVKRSLPDIWTVTKSQGKILSKDGRRR